MTEVRRSRERRVSVREVGLAAVLLTLLMIAVLCPAIALAASPPTFARTTYATCVGPTWVEPIDVTGDGLLDLVVAGEGDDSVVVLEGDGHGDFAVASSVPSGGDGPYSLDVAELTGDAHDDVAVVNRWSKTVTILSGDGAGRFTFVRSIAVGTEPIDVKAMDLDEDGDLDLVSCNMWTTSLNKLFNNGTGSFSRVDVPLPVKGATVMGVGDLNKDGHVDVAVGHYWATSESVLLGDGRGGLTVSRSLEVGPYPQGAVFDDFDRDGDEDICVTSRYPNSANIFLGNGTGAFTGPTSYGVGQYAKVPIAADLNLDGALDIAACNYGNDALVSTTLSILTGHGDGTFDPQSLVQVGGKPHSVAVADFDRDGRLDLAVPNWATHNVSVLLNTTPFTQLDTTPPVTTCSADDAWHRGQVTVTFAATDTQSGVAYTRYRVDAGTWQTGTSFPVSADGVHSVEYYSVDNAGNTEVTRAAQVKIDNTAPSVTLTRPTDGASYAQGSGATCDWSSSDALSGVAGEVATIDGIPVAKGARIDTLSPGSHAFVLTVTDVAGNKRTLSATFDVTGGLAGVTVTAPPTGTGRYAAGDPLTVELDDELRGHERRVRGLDQERRRYLVQRDHRAHQRHRQLLDERQPERAADSGYVAAVWYRPSPRHGLDRRRRQSRGTFSVTGGLGVTVTAPPTGTGPYAAGDPLTVSWTTSAAVTSGEFGVWIRSAGGTWYNETRSCPTTAPPATRRASTSNVPPDSGYVAAVWYRPSPGLAWTAGGDSPGTFSVTGGLRRHRDRSSHRHRPLRRR